ncbi:MAG: transglycosylase domain-containing protein [Actinobacteria bacterium]|nr:transglycosylase domain-containing protein [Actinomycetota bacterium]MCB9411410.1 transglycosylase domain-containing protein [Actinomycetota bacterium]
MPKPTTSTRTKVIAGGMFVAVSVAAGVVVAGMALPAAGAIGGGAQAAVDVYGGLPTEFTAPPLPRKSVVTASDGTEIATIFSENRVEVPLEAISTNLQHAIVAIEDSRFFEHNGVDLRGTARALANNAAGEEVQGASTITMQYVKNVLVTTAETPEEAAAATAVTPSRKLQEMRYAIEVEKELTKPQILNNYLNISYFGAGAYGAEAAALRYFSKPASQLTISEAALLAGLVQSPTVYDPTIDPLAAQVRRDVVLDRMLELRYITPEEHAAAKAEAVVNLLNPSEPINGCAASEFPYFCDYAVRQVQTDPRFGATPEERAELLKTGGLTITTTLDLNAQYSAQDAVFSYIPAEDPSGKAAAIAMVEPGTGEVIAMTQNRTWGDGPGQTTYNYAVDQADGGTIGMQAGSTFKIFTIASAIEQGLNPYERVDAKSQMFYPAGDWGCNGEVFESFVGKNASDYGGNYDMFTAAALSSNTWFLQRERDAGICNVVDMAQRAGVESAIDAEIPPTITFTLGVTEVSPLVLANAYATFANHGVYCAPRAVLSVTDRYGNQTTTEAQCEERIPRDVADATTAVLTNVVDGSISGRTGVNMSLGRETTGKTGTSDSNSAVWYAGYTPDLAAAVWVGDPRGGFQYPMQDVVINGQFYSEVYGGELPGPIWRQAMLGALSDTPYSYFDLEAKYGLVSAQSGGGPNPSKSALLEQQIKASGIDTSPHGPAPRPMKYVSSDADPNAAGSQQQFLDDTYSNQYNGGYSN